MGIFASAVAVCLLLIASQDRPFAGPFAVRPDETRCWEADRRPGCLEGWLEEAIRLAFSEEELAYRAAGRLVRGASGPA